MQGNSCIVLVNKQKHIFRAAFCRICIALVAIFARWDRIVSLSIRGFGSVYAVVANPMRRMGISYHAINCWQMDVSLAKNAQNIFE